ncbi:MAG: bifunctional diaminohydroxyphosphoribosylaminopyrimidine deaminase/5-amino-6-(5-phosphoribosylamino)uracil reductase RibD [SAR324 cluster bacterium]|nr:bifunctional diaminohydroxyphosphoribosylaminopyrimidine deaminase/5-amino-6-(5-phosphoribosylamino)uracil reductase RibD [SAR324 cluster bacterium]
MQLPDEHWMRQAIQIGETVRGKTGDNPHVGCVLVEKNQLLVKGWTHPPWQHHAEAHAIHQAQELGLDFSKLTLYCTLEPCAFVGRTPACAKTISEVCIRHVVVGIRDPHPRVDGAGILIMRNAGVEVKEGLCVDEIRESLRDWLRRFEE